MSEPATHAERHQIVCTFRGSEYGRWSFTSPGAADAALCRLKAPSIAHTTAPNGQDIATEAAMRADLDGIWKSFFAARRTIEGY